MSSKAGEPLIVTVDRGVTGGGGGLGSKLAATFCLTTGVKVSGVPYGVERVE